MPDVVLVGAGPAGCAAAWVCAGAGLDTLLLTDSLDTVFHSLMPLNPADWHDSDVGLLSAAAEGPEVKTSRQLTHRVRWILERQPGLHLMQASASAILTSDGKVTGVGTWEGPVFHADVVGLCVGSFLDARLEQGSLVEAAGKPGQMSYQDLARDLETHGLRLKSAERVHEGKDFRAKFTSLVLAEGQSGDGPWLDSPAGLAAAGYVVDPDCSFAAAAAAGQALGEAVADRLRRGRGSVG